MSIRPLILPVTLVSLAGAGGFFAGRQFPVHTAVATASVAAKITAGTKATSSKSGGQVRPGTEANFRRGESGVSTPSARLLETLEEMAESKQQGAIENLLSTWLAGNPDEMLQFLSSSPRRDDILRKITTLWAGTDPAAASSWLAGHPDTAGHDAMAAGLAAAVVKDEPDAALQWVASINDPLQKLAGAQAAGYEFFRQSDETALEALRKMGMPASSIEPAMLELWKRRLGGVSRRGAQNLASAYAAAKAAGGDLKPENVEEVIAALNEGIKGAGQFSSTLFKVDTTGYTERERGASKTHLEISGETLSYTGER